MKGFYTMTIRTVSAIAASMFTLAACGGSFGATEPELPSTTANAAPLASAFSEAMTSDGTAAFEQFRRDNAHLGRWAVDAAACVGDFYDVGSSRLVEGANNRACAYNGVARGDTGGSPAIGLTAVCPVVGAEPDPEGNIETEEVTYTFVYPDGIESATLDVNGTAIAVTRCDILLAPPEPEAEEETEE